LVAEQGTVVGYEGAEQITNDELIALEVDVLVPAALGGVLHERNARDVRTGLIIEGANAPTTPAADEILRERGVTVVPDILANAGGVTVSYFEWVQNLQQFRWTAERVDDELQRIMKYAYGNVTRMAAEHGVTLRTAAFRVAGQGGAAAVELRGVGVDTIAWDDVARVALRVGRVVEARTFPEARNPAYVLHVDFGPDIGVKKSSARITELYRAEDLVGRLVV